MQEGIIQAVRNFRHETKNGKSVLETFSSPQFIQGREGWIDIQEEYADVISLDSEEELTQEQQDRAKKYVDLMRLRVNNTRAKIILDIAELPENLQVIGATTEFRNKIRNNYNQNPLFYVWLDGADGISGEVIFRDTMHTKSVFVHDDTGVTFLTGEEKERPYYTRQDGEIHLFVDGFSGGGNGADPEVIDTFEFGENVGDIVGTLYDNGDLEVEHFDGSTDMKDFAIGDSPVHDDTRVEHIEIVHGITRVGDHSLRSMSNCTSVNIPDSVTTIGDWAFASNSISSLTIPDSVTTIGDSAFAYNSISSLTIPDSVTTIENSAFRSNLLTSLTIPDSVTTIGDDAFRSNSLTSLTIPDSVTTIGDWAFRYNSISSLTIPDSVTTIGDSAFRNNSLTSLTIPDSVTTIETSAFASNSISSLTIPDSVTTIGGYAFGDNSLTSVIMPVDVTVGVHTDTLGDYGLKAYYEDVEGGNKEAGCYEYDTVAETWSNLGDRPYAQTNLPTNVGETSATLNGEITDLGHRANVSVYFQYAKIPHGYLHWGVTWQTTTPQNVNSVTTIDAEITELDAGEEYQYRMVTEFDGFVIYGEHEEFKAAEEPILTDIIRGLRPGLFPKNKPISMPGGFP